MRPASTHQRRWQDGRTLQRAPLNPRCEELYGAPHLTVHRADLLSIIASGFPAERVHLGHRLVGLADRGRPRRGPVRQRRTRIASTCWSAPTASIRRCAPRCSARRRRASPAASPIAAWCPSSASPTSDSRSASQSWLGPGGHFVHYFVSRGRLLNFVGWTEHDTWNREDWTDRATVARALAAFDGWHPRCGGSSRPPIPASSGRCSIASRCRDGRSAARRCSATRAIRCTRSWVRARRRPSRMAPPSPPASSPAATTIRPRRCGATNAAPATRHPPSGDVARQQDALPPAGRPGAGSA